MANVDRSIWADEYALIVAAVAINGQVGADSTVWNTATVNASYDFEAGAIGVDSNKYGLQLTNHPTFDPGQNIINQRKALGTSYRRAGTGYEFQQGTRLPTTTWEFDVTKKNIVPFLWTLFQKGLSEGAASVYLKTFTAYTETTGADCEAYLALLRKMSGENTDSHVIGGAICRSLTLSVTEGEPLKASAEMIGYNMVTDFDFNAGSSIIEYDTTAPLLWQNATVEIEDTAVNIPGFSLTISNNAVPKFYDSPHPLKYVLGDLTAEGTISVPWGQATKGGNTEFDRFVAGTESYLEIYWGNETPSADGDFKIYLNMKYTGAANVGDDEILTELPFIAVCDSANSEPSATSSLLLYSGESVNRSIP